MSETNFLYWMAVSESEPVRFSELSHMMAKAMYPSDAELNHYASTRVNLDSELPRAVREGELVVRNPAGMGKHTFPYGAALQSAVILPDDLRPFLAERGIELRLTPHGSGPEYWTLENAAVALQDQEGWHGGTMAAFLDQLQDAAQHGAMVIRDPQTCLAIRPQIVRTFWELVTPADVNAWLEKQAAPYRWKVDPSETEPEPAPVVADSASNAPAWTVNKPKRYNGYAAPLHRLLAAAYRDDKPCPTARDVVEAWRNNAPAEIAKVLPDGFDYYDAKGDTKTADLEAIRKAIGRMTIAR